MTVDQSSPATPVLTADLDGYRVWLGPDAEPVQVNGLMADGYAAYRLAHEARAMLWACLAKGRIA